MNKVLVIDNYDSYVYNMVQLLRESVYAPVCEVVRNDAIPFSRLGEYGGIVLSPGPGIPSEAGGLCRLVAVCKYTHPLLGICLGHQAIAGAFGAGLCNMPLPLHGHPTVLRQVDRRDPLFEGLDFPFVVGRYHSWVVDPRSVPGELAVSSWDEEGDIMSFYHSRLPIHGLQFHPESCISNCGRQIVDNWLKKYVVL